MKRIFSVILVLGASIAVAQTNTSPVDFVNPLMGTQSKPSFQTEIHILLLVCPGG